MNQEMPIGRKPPEPLKPIASLARQVKKKVMAERGITSGRQWRKLRQRVRRAAK